MPFHLLRTQSCRRVSAETPCENRNQRVLQIRGCGGKRIDLLEYIRRRRPKARRRLPRGEAAAARPQSSGRRNSAVTSNLTFVTRVTTPWLPFAVNDSIRRRQVTCGRVLTYSAQAAGLS